MQFFHPFFVVLRKYTHPLTIPLPGDCFLTLLCRVQEKEFEMGEKVGDEDMTRDEEKKGRKTMCTSEMEL